MPIRFACSNCGARIRVPDGSGGKKTRCPRCGTALRIPEKSIEPPPAAPPAETPTPSTPVPSTAAPSSPPAISVAAPPVSGQSAPPQPTPTPPTPALSAAPKPEHPESSSISLASHIEVPSSPPPPPPPASDQPPTTLSPLEPPAPLITATDLSAALPPTLASVGLAVPDRDRLPESPSSPLTVVTPLAQTPSSPPVPPSSAPSPAVSSPVPTPPSPPADLSELFRLSPPQKRLATVLAWLLSLLGLLGIGWSLFAGTYRLTAARNMDQVLPALATLIFGTGISLLLTGVGLLSLLLLQPRSGSHPSSSPPT